MIDFFLPPEDCNGENPDEDYDETTDVSPASENLSSTTGFLIEVWKHDLLPLPIFWVMLALGTTSVECINATEPYYTEEVAIARAMTEAQKRKVPYRPETLLIRE